MNIILERVTATARRDAAPAADAVAKLMGDLSPSGTWPDMKYADQSNGNWSPSEHLSRVQRMAVAYSTPKLSDGKPNPSFHSAPLLEATLRAYDGWFSVLPPGTPNAIAHPGNAFKDDLITPTSKNWWHNEIGVPLKMSDILLLLPDEIEGQRRQNGLTIMARSHAPNGATNTAANLTWRSRVTTSRAAMTQDVALLNEVIDTLNHSLQLGEPEGPQPDYSFHQHGAQFYLLGYGLGFSSDLLGLSELYQGTVFTLRPEMVDLLTHLQLEGYQWVMRGPSPDFNAQGRGVANPRKLDTREMVGNIDRLLALNAPRQTELKAFKARLLNQKDAPPLIGNRAFWRSGFMAHQRAEYSVSVRVTPATLRGGEVINGQGQQSRYTGDGVTYLMRGGNEYLNLHPVMNFRLLPGTTGALSPQKPTMPGPYVEGVGHFAGGVSDGMYGATAYDYARDGVSARKSWFFFDDEYVCLGAGISADAGVADPTVSSIEQRRTTAPFEHSPNGAPGASWVAQDGTGYVFLDHSATIQARVGPQTGSWLDVNSDATDKKPITEQVFSLYLDHGAHPQNASYAYIVVPNADAHTLPAYAANPPIEVLSNTPQLQAVQHAKLNLIQAVFYAPGTLTIRPNVTLSVSQPCLLLWNERMRRVTIADLGHSPLPDSTNPVAPPKPLKPQTPIVINVEVSTSSAPAQRVTFTLPTDLFAGQSVTQTVPPLAGGK